MCRIRIKQWKSCKTLSVSGGTLFVRIPELVRHDLVKIRAHCGGDDLYPEDVLFVCITFTIRRVTGTFINVVLTSVIAFRQAIISNI